VIPSELTPAILEGEVREVLGRLPDESIHCVVTSPPYWGLRDYGLPPVLWGGSPSCPHEWDSLIPGNTKGGTGTPNGRNAVGAGYARGERRGRFCLSCDAWLGQLGLEPTAELFVQHLAGIFDEVRRVLRSDGTLWLNLGDTFQGDSPVRRSSSEAFSDRWDPSQTRGRGGSRRSAARSGDLKPKDLAGIPWRVTLELQRRGWWLRSDCVWAKPNPMPESVRDRPTRSHEYVFLLTKSNRYFYDADGVRQPYRPATRLRLAQATFDSQSGGPKDYGSRSNRSARRALVNLKGRMMAPQIEGAPRRFSPLGANLRSVWWIPTHGYPEAHFATFPETLAETCIRAGTTDHGACRKCGSPLRRVVEADYKFLSKPLNPERPRSGFATPKPKGQSDSISGSKATKAGGWDELPRAIRIPRTVGWKRSCCCGGGGTVPSIVLDPFAGSGTTLAVAHRLGRRSIGIELKPEYADLARRRTSSFTLAESSHAEEAHA
jgi:DNA modification methylase